MKISVNRKQKPGQLTFTITVKNPMVVEIPDEIKQAMDYLDSCKEAVKNIPVPDKINPLACLSHIQILKQNTFERIKGQITAEIQGKVHRHIASISQEIYNMIYDSQEDYAKQLFQELDPQRTTYYFDNDKKSESHISSPIISDFDNLD